MRNDIVQHPVPRGRGGFKFRFAACLTLLVLTTSIQAGGKPASYSVLEGITVKATKTPRDPFDVPESVSIVDEERIEAEQASDIGDILENLPNVDIGGGPRAGGERFVIRGLDDERVLFLLDGARQNFVRGHIARVFVDPDLLKQVEVLRGPASALWGSGTVGGVMAFTTKDAVDMLVPGERFGSRIKGGYQGVNEQRLASAAVYGLAGDNFDYLLNIAFRDADDLELGDGTTLDNSGFESVAGLAKGTWTPGPFHTFSGSFQTFDKDAGVPSNPQGAATPTNLVDRDTEQRNITLRYHYENPDNPLLQLSAVLYRNTTDMVEIRRSDGRHDETEFTTTGFDVRNSMVFGATGAIRQVLTYGVDFYRDATKARRNGAPRTSFPDGKSTVLGVYVQDEIAVGKRWTLTPGLRWDRYQSKSDAGIARDIDENELSVKLGAGVQVTDWLSLHAAYNEAFRAPNLTELFTSGTHFTCGPRCANLFVPNPDLRPEKANNKEVSVRLRSRDLFVPGDRGRFRATFFQNDVDDFIDAVVNFSPSPMPPYNLGRGGISTNRNVRDAELKGYELELTYDAPRWFAALSYAQTRGDNKTTGEPLSAIPADEWDIRLGLRSPAKHLSLGWHTRIVDDQNRVPGGGTTTEGYTVHDLNLTWAPTREGLKGLRVDFGIDNVTDKDYRRHNAVLKEPGRNVKMSVSYRF